MDKLQSQHVENLYDNKHNITPMISWKYIYTSFVIHCLIQPIPAIEDEVKTPHPPMSNTSDILIVFLCVSCLIFSSCSYVYHVWYPHFVPMCIVSDILILFLCVSCLIFSSCFYAYHVWYSHPHSMCNMSDIFILFLCVICLIFSSSSYV
jgi:heme/copper-type cytochrome/quinol oxidase subunit 3